MTNDARISQAPAIYAALSEGVTAFEPDYDSMMDGCRCGEELHQFAQAAVRGYEKARAALDLISPVGDQFRRWSAVAGDLHEAALAFRSGTLWYVFGNPELAEAHRKLTVALARVGQAAA